MKESHVNSADRMLSSESIKAEAARLGFDACGMAVARPVDPDTVEAYRQWLRRGDNGVMDYMNRYDEIRFNPTLLLPGCRTIVSLAMNYYPSQRIDDDRPQLAYYAYGKDYHDVMKSRIRQLAKAIGLNSEYSEHSDNSNCTDDEPRYRVAVDSAPILERYWAMQAGIGWIGRNRNLIIHIKRERGSLPTWSIPVLHVLKTQQGFASCLFTGPRVLNTMNRSELSYLRFRHLAQVEVLPCL